MMKALRSRLQQGYRTMKYPKGPPAPMPERFRGLPLLDSSSFDPESAAACVEACPTGALRLGPTGATVASLDLGLCIFCGACEAACPPGAIQFGKDYRLAARKRSDLILEAGRTSLDPALPLEGRIRRLLGRSLKLREVSAGGCNGCESDVNVLNTVGWDLGRFGVQFVASPRHADGILITGPVTKNMELALRKTWDAIPGPKIAIAVGACAISGGIYAGLPETGDGVGERVPVDLYIPGCPPHPLTILDGILRLIGRIKA